VRVEDAKAQLGSNSRGTVKADPDNNSSEILVSTVRRRCSVAKRQLTLRTLRSYDSQQRRISKVKRAGASDLVAPLNLSPIYCGQSEISPVRFEWKPVPDAVSYTLRISTTSMLQSCDGSPRSKDRPSISPAWLLVTTFGPLRRQMEDRD